MIELKETAELMLSENYKDRFKAEYHQLRIRTEKLEGMLVAWDSNELNFVPTCPRSLYDLQLRAMRDYLAILEARAMIERVDIDV